MTAADVVVVGAGPNGLAAAVTLARAGANVTVLERANEIGGGTRSAELTEPGYVHDVCSAIHPLVLASPFFRSLSLEDDDLEMVHPQVPLAQPLDYGRSVALHRSVADTADGLGADGRAYKRLMEPLVEGADELVADLLRPVRLPRHPIVTGRFGVRGIRSVVGLARRFEGDGARALFGGLAAHSMLPLSSPPTAGFGLLLGVLAHAVGWPAARGGSAQIAAALARSMTAHGGQIETGVEVGSLADLPPAAAYVFDVTPAQLIRIAGPDLPTRYVRALGRFRYGPGVFKMDWALSGPVPWTDPHSRGAGTVHVGGTLEEMAASEATVVGGGIPEKPYVLVAQQSLFDDTRAPDGGHTLWAYCHVPSGSDVDMTDAIEDQIERFAPGFRDVIVARAVRGPAAIEAHDPNFVGGDINSGIQNIKQHIFRPVIRLNPYSTPNPKIFLCSSSTPPGGGVHGMCGYLAATSVLRRLARG